MAKDITLKSPNGEEIYYPKTVSDLVFDNETGETLKNQIREMNTVISDLVETNINDCNVKHLLYTYICKFTKSNVEIEISDLQNIDNYRACVCYTPVAPNNPKNLTKTTDGYNGSIDIDGTDKVEIYLFTIDNDNSLFGGNCNLKIKENPVDSLKFKTKQLDSKIDSINDNMESKINLVSEELYSEIVDRTQKLDSKIDSVNEDVNKHNTVLGENKETLIEHIALPLQSTRNQPCFTYTTNLDNAKIIIELSNLTKPHRIGRVYRPSAPNNSFSLLGGEDYFYGEFSMDGFEAGTTFEVYLWDYYETQEYFDIKIIEYNPNSIYSTIDSIKNEISETEQSISLIDDDILEIQKSIGLDKHSEFSMNDIIVQTGLKPIYTYTSLFEDSSITVNITDFTIEKYRAICYINQAGTNQNNLTLTEDGFTGTISLNGWEAGTSLLIYIYNNTEETGTCNLNIIESKECDNEESVLYKVRQLENSINKVKTPYYGMKAVCIGDSHSVRRASWMPHLCNGIGAEYDSSTSSVIVGSGNNCGTSYEYCADPVYAQAVRAVEQYNQGNTFDILFLENVHYSLNESDFKNAYPLNIQNVIELGNKDIKISNVSNWFNTNINTILGSETSSIGSMVHLKCSDTKYKLTFSGTPQAGECVVTVNGSDFNATVTNEDTLSDVVQALGIWVFGDYTEWSNTYDESTITLSYKGSLSEIPTPTVTFNAGSTNISMTTQKITEYSDSCIYFSSNNTSDWLDSSKWVIQGSFSANGLKGAYEHLMKNIPNLIIVTMAFPCYGITTNQFNSMNEFYTSTFYSNNRNRANTLLLAGQYYNTKCIDIEKLSNITLSNWFEYNSSGDVHPKDKGYIRWADTVIRELV